MGSSLNKVMLIGRLGQDPEQRFTGSGTPVCNLSLATDEYDGKDEDGKVRTRTEWHAVVAYGKVAEVCGQYLSKGSQVYIEGRIQTRKWEDKKTGEPRQKAEIVANQLVMLGSKQDRTGGSRRNVDRQEEAPDSEDVPF